MNQYFDRKITPIFNQYLKEKQVIVITGMRRVGKTTLLKHAFEGISSSNKLYLNLENVLTRKLLTQDNYEDIKASLEREGLRFGLDLAYLFIDEIQFLPNIPSVIKYLYDQYPIKFVVTGSSSYYLKNYFTESLAGRKFVLELRPLTFSEFLTFKGKKTHSYANLSELIGHSGDLEYSHYKNLYQEYIEYGGFPEVVLNPNQDIKKALLEDIISSYFQIDVTTLAQFKDVAILRDLLALLTQRIGQKVNITNLATVLKIPRQQVYEYIELLKYTYVIDTLGQKTSVDNQISADDKLYFSDTGLARTLANISEGSLFENSVYMNLIYDHKLTYYQTSSRGEIDFVLDKQIGLEVKETISQSDLANLNRRREVAKLKEGYLIGRHPTSIVQSIMAWDL